MTDCWSQSDDGAMLIDTCEDEYFPTLEVVGYHFMTLQRCVASWVDTEFKFLEACDFDELPF